MAIYIDRYEEENPPETLIHTYENTDRQYACMLNLCVVMSATSNVTSLWHEPRSREQTSRTKSTKIREGIVCEEYEFHRLQARHECAHHALIRRSTEPTAAEPISKRPKVAFNDTFVAGKNDEAASHSHSLHKKYHAAPTSPPTTAPTATWSAVW